MDNIPPSMATTATAAAPQQQQHRMRRKAAVSSANNVVASAGGEDMMLVPPDDDDRNGGGKENNEEEDRSIVPPAAIANYVGGLPPSDATVVGSSPPLLPFASTSSSSCCSSSVLVVQKDLNTGYQHPPCDGSSGSDAGSGYGSSSSGGKHGNNNNKNNGHNSKKKTALSAHAVEYLKNWMMSPEHVDHPYPTEDEKLRIMNETGIVLKQLTNWFVNNRKRYWKPKVEELKRQLTGDMGGGIAGPSLEVTEVAAVDRGDGGVASSTVTASMTTGKTNTDGKDGGARGVGLGGQPSSQSRREDGNNTRRPAPSSHSSGGGGGGGKRRNKRPAPANEDAETTSAAMSTSGGDTGNRRARKASGEVAQCPVNVDSVASANVATAVSTRVNANGSYTSVVSDESAEEGGGARVGGGRRASSGTEEESGDDTDEIGNVAVTNPLLEDAARATGTYADSISTPISSNVVSSKFGIVRGNHKQQVTMMINMEYSINPLDMDDNDDDLIQNNMAVDRTICCSSILPHSCSDPKNRGMLCALCSACRDWNLGEFCPWDLTGIIGDISTDNVLQATPQDPSTTSFSTSEDYGNGMSLPSLVTSSSRSGSTHSEDGSSAHYETSSTEEGGTTVVTKNSTVAEEAMGAAAGCIEPTMMATYANFSVPQEISHSTSAADFMSSMADIESWD